MQISGNQQHAGLSEIFQFRIQNPDRGGKPLAVGGSMIALVERGREMPSPIRLFTGNLAQRNLLSFPPGLRVGRGDFSGNNARDFPTSDFGLRGDISYPGRPYDRPCRARPRNALSLIHISEPTRLLSISYAAFCLKKKRTGRNG